jgi:hypothetical protein
VTNRAREGLLRRALAWGAPLLVAAIVVANAARGLMPGVGFWDTGEFQTVLPILGTAHPTGYPTYVLLGYLANIVLTPLGEPAFRITVLSLLAIATASGLTVAIVRRLTGSTLIGIAAGLGLALTPVVWANATRADPHPIYLAFVAILLLLLVTWEQKRRAAAADADRWLVGAALAFGLAAGTHSLTLLLALPIALFVLATEPRIVRRPRLIATCALVLIGSVALVYLELPLRAGPFRAPLVYAHPETWGGFWDVALAEQFRGSLHDPFGDLGDKLGAIGELAWAQFGLLTPALVPAFAATIWRAPRYALLTGTAMVITLLFNASYDNADIGRYYLGPVLWAWTWLGIGAGVVVRAVVGVVVRVVAGAATAGAAADVATGSETVRPRVELANGLAGGLAFVLAAVLLAPGVATSTSSRLQADRSGDRYAGIWLREALATVAPNAVIVSYWTTSTALWYGQFVEGLRPDVFVADDRTIIDQNLGGATDVIAKYLGQRPVYITRANGYDLGLVLELYDLQPVMTADGVQIGNGSETLYQVTGRRVASG